MVTFKLIEKKGNIYHYEYYPQDIKKNKGVVIFNPVEKKLIKKYLLQTTKMKII